MTLNKTSLVSCIDADTISYLVSYRAKDEENADIVLNNVDEFFKLILNNTSCTHYIGFIGGSRKVFRHDISGSYKANRGESPDWYKKWGGVIKAHLRDKWKFTVVNNIEADDAVSIASHELRLQDINHIIVGADKDLLQIEGNHYNLRTHQRSYVDKINSDKNLFKQILKGDVADNLKYLKGIGDKKASQYIDGLSTLEELVDITQQLFINQYKELGLLKYSEAISMFQLLIDPTPYTDLKLDYIEVPRLDIPDSLDEIIADIWD